MALQPHRLEFKPHRLEFIFGMVLAMAVTILAITTWAAPRILTTIRLRRSRRFTGLTTRICTKGYGLSRTGALEVPVAHRPAATLSNVKGKRDAPSLPANVTCLHSTQTNRSEPTMCVSGMPGAQSCKCSCEVTFAQPKHSFVTMVRHLCVPRTPSLLIT
jgi:hypothetical protein